MSWKKASEILPVENVSVFVFIPEEDNHVTTGMWDKSKKWVLLDDYRVPTAQVTYWHPMIELPMDREYEPTFNEENEGSPKELIRSLQKELYDANKFISEAKSAMKSAHKIYQKYANDDPYEDHVMKHIEELIK